MRLVKSVFTIQFAAAMNAWLEMRRLLRVASSNPNAEIQAAPLVIDRAEERKRIVVQVRGISFEQELPDAVDQALREINTLMSNFHETVPLPEIQNITHHLIFIEPFSMPFHELVSLMKQRFLIATRLSSVASDLAIVLDTRDDEGVRNIHVGPMDRAQLQEDILRWPTDDLPDTFALLNGSFQVEWHAEFTPERLEPFLKRSAEIQTEAASLFIQELTEQRGG
jgi:hypothetical protein